MHPSSRPQPGTTRMSKMLRDGFRLIIATMLAFVSFVAHAGEWIADAKTGCQVWNYDPSPGDSISWTGPCSNGKATGTGTLQWYLNSKPGSRYEGEFRDGIPHGKGTIVWVDGTRYEGDWSDGKRHGKGTLFRVNGNRYEGEFRDGKKHGFGIFYMANDTDYLNDGASEIGKQYGTIVGLWRNDKVYKRFSDCNSQVECERKEAAVAAAAPPGSAILKARLVRLYDGQKKVLDQTCSFYYPFDDAFTFKVKENGYVFTWTGSCQDGYLHGSGDLGVAKITPRDGTSHNRGYRNASFEFGKQNGHLVITGEGANRIPNGIELSGDASNFYFSGMFSAKGEECTAGLIFCTQSTTYDDNMVWINGPHHFTWWKDSGKRYRCDKNQTLQQCQWAAVNETSISNKISDAEKNGQCKLLAGLVKEANTSGGLGYSEESRMKYCSENATFFTLVNGSDPQKMFLSAGQYESRGERSRAKTIYNSIISRFSKSPVAVHATNRLTALSDVEAVENAGYSAAAANRAAADSVRSQNYQQCQNNRDACFRGCNGLKGWSAQSSCQNGCPICAQ